MTNFFRCNLKNWLGPTSSTRSELRYQIKSSIHNLEVETLSVTYLLTYKQEFYNTNNINLHKLDVLGIKSRVFLH